MKKEAHTMNEKTLTSEQRATLIAYMAKHEYNKGREYRHGGKRA